MKFFSGIVKCVTCEKPLGKTVDVPESDLLVAMNQAATRSFCPGHSKNTNIDIDWKEQAPPDGAITDASIPLGNGPINHGVVVVRGPEVLGGERHVITPEDVEGNQEVPAPKITADGIALSDLSEAAGEPIAMAPNGDLYVEGKDENGMAVPMLVIGKNPPRQDQLG